MTEPEFAERPAASVEEIQREWKELKLKVEQAAAERSTIEAENKALRFLMERLIEHRQRSHGDLVNFLVELVGKLPLNNIGLLVSRLVDHNAEVCEVCVGLLKGKAEVVSKPALLKSLDDRKQAIRDAIRPAVEQLVRLESPLESAPLEALVEHPELFFTPGYIRANRCFVKGQVPRERIAREFGEAALAFFDDLTTDKRFNPRPKPEEIVLGFKDGFETLVSQASGLETAKREAMLALHRRVQRSRSATPEAREQRQVFARLSFLLELLRYYENPATEAPDAVFAQRLPAAVEQLAMANESAELDESTLARIEELLAFIIKPEHRHMVVNNLGKSWAGARTLKYVLALRAEPVVDLDHVLAEFVRHLIPTPPQPAPPVAGLTRLLRLLPSNMQRLLLGAIMSSDRRRREELTEVGRALAAELGLKGLEEAAKVATTVPPETERRMAWEDIKDRILKREEAGTVANAIRERLHTRYDVEEVKESWLALIEADAVSFIRLFCQLPYLPSGKTDPIAHAVMQAYVGRLLHEKYAAFYHKVVNSLRNMHKANPHSPTLNNFLAMVKWADAAAGDKLSADVGLHGHS
jgi:hypothetical protein